MSRKNIKKFAKSLDKPRNLWYNRSIKRKETSQTRKGKIMKTVKLYLCWNQEAGAFYSIERPNSDWTEITDIHDFFVPEGYEIAMDAAGSKHFYSTYDSSYPALLRTSKNENPYLLDGLKTVKLERA